MEILNLTVIDILVILLISKQITSINRLSGVYMYCIVCKQEFTMLLTEANITQHSQIAVEMNYLVIYQKIVDKVTLENNLNTVYN